MAPDLQEALTGKVLVLTGAGISAESGLPTFRDPNGYWRKLDPTRLATRQAFASDPRTVWAWYNSRRRALRKARPNAAHRAMARLARKAKDFLLVTQNVDNLHERGGLPGKSLVHIHGTLLRDRCMSCGYLRRALPRASGVPRCPRCGSNVRPDVVWFDEELDPGLVERVDRFVSGRPVDIVLVVGTNATFDYIRRWALAAQQSGALMVEVNPNGSELTRYADHVVTGPAAEVLPGLLRGTRRSG